MSALHLLSIVDQLSSHVGQAERLEDALAAVLEHALAAIKPAEHATATRRTPDGYQELAATDATARHLAALHLMTGAGPAFTVLEQEPVLRIDDLRTGVPWPDFGRRAVNECGVLAVLAVRMEVDGATTSLALYAKAAGAFGEPEELAAKLLARYAGATVTTARQQARIDNLERALETNREIGIAIGILMALQRITREQAFEQLRHASQVRHRKLADIARDVVDTGTLSPGR